MLRTVKALRALWLALMAVLLVLVLTNTIGGFAMAAYGAVVLLVMIAELMARNKIVK
jgi:hypothetical protein